MFGGLAERQRGCVARDSPTRWKRAEAEDELVDAIIREVICGYTFTDPNAEPSRQLLVAGHDEPLSQLRIDDLETPRVAPYEGRTSIGQIAALSQKWSRRVSSFVAFRIG
jgi:hypothetical protein